MEGHQSVYKFRNKLIRANQADVSAVDLQPVEGRSIQAGETLKAIQRSFLFKDLGITLKGMRGIENARTATGTFLRGS